MLLCCVSSFSSSSFLLLIVLLYLLQAVPPLPAFLLRLISLLLSSYPFSCFFLFLSFFLSVSVPIFPFFFFLFFSSFFFSISLPPSFSPSFSFPFFFYLLCCFYEKRHVSRVSPGQRSNFSLLIFRGILSKQTLISLYGDITEENVRLCCICFVNILERMHCFVAF